MSKLLRILRHAGLFSVVAALLWLFPAGAAWAGLGASVTIASGQAGTIYPGEITQLQITLSNNNGAAAITSATFSNSLPGSLPNGLKVAGPAVYSCADANGAVATTGSVTAAPGSQTITLADGSIPARASNTDGTCTITIPVTAGSTNGSGATYTYTIANGAVTGNDGVAVANSGAVSQSVNVRPVVLPVVSKGFSSSVAFLGGAPVTLSVTVNNPNSIPLPNFSLADIFPQLGGQALIKVAPTPAATSICTGGGTPASFAPAADDTSISASGGTVAANGSCTLTVQVVANQTDGKYDSGLQTNTIQGSSVSNDLGLVPGNATAQIRTRSPLRVAKAFAHPFLSSGQSDTLSIQIFNDGTAPLTINSFTDEPIDGLGNALFGLKVSGAVSASCLGSGVTGNYLATAGNLGITQTTDTTIAAGSSCTITVPFTGTAQTAHTPISFTNTIAQGSIGTTTPGVFSQTASAAITVADDLRVTKNVSPANAAPGNPVRYSVTVENFSGSAIPDVAISDALGNGQTFLTGTINGINFSPSVSAGCGALAVIGATGSTVPVLSIGLLPARVNANTPGTCTVSFYAMTSIAGATATNSLGIGSVCSGAVCNGEGSNSTSVPAAPTLGVVKSFALASPKPEGTVTRMNITVTNNSANPVTSLSIADTLPVAGTGGQMRLATPANAASTCGSPTITAVDNSTSIAMSAGTIAGRASNGMGLAGTCLLQVDVVAPAGTYNNMATVSGTESYADGSPHTVTPVTANAGFTYTSALSAAKSFVPAAVSSGGKSTLTVRLANSAAGAVSSVALTDPLPAGMVVATPSNAYTTCAGSTSIVATPGASSASLSGAAIAGNGNCDLVFDVLVSGSANWVNTIPAGNITAAGGVSNQTPVSGTLLYSAPNNPSLVKASNPSSLTFPGQFSVLSITVTSGTQAISNFRFTDYFTVDGSDGAPLNGMVVASTANASTTCPGGVVSASPGATAVSLSGAALAANSSCIVTVNVTSVSVGGITNYLPIGSIRSDQGLSNSGQASANLTTQSNLGVVKQFTPNVVKPGQRSRLRISFYNPTALPVSSLAVLDTLPAGVSVAIGPNPATTCVGASVSSPAANQVQVSGGTIAAASGGIAASCYAEIDVVVSAQGDFVNTIAAGAVTAVTGGSSVSNSQATSDTLRAKSPVVIHKAIASRTLDSGNPSGFTTGTANAAPGVPSILTIRLENPNAVQLTSAAFTDSLPAGLVVAPTPGAATSCTGGAVFAAASATSIRLSGATIPAAGWCTVSVNVLSNISGTYTNTIAGANVTTSEGVSNEDPTSAQIIVSTPPTVGKQFSPAVIPPGGTSTLSIVFGNSNASTINLTAAFTDTLPIAPGPIVVAALPAITSTCGGGLGAVTAVAGSGSVSLASGSSIPVGGCSITVSVSGTISGVHTNNIPAGALFTDVGSNQQAANATLTISTLGYVSGRVFRDNNVLPNGIYDSTDSPIPSTSIELYGGASCAGALVNIPGLSNPASTDALGNYLFAGLPAGVYSVCEPLQPLATSNGLTTAGSIASIGGSSGSAGTASNPTATTSQIVGIALNAAGGGEVSGSSGNDFAEIVLSSIAGTVFLDLNNNGVRNGADTGISGVAINLGGYSYGPDGVDNSGAGDDLAVSRNTTTDGSGNYVFSALAPGKYTLTEPTQPPSTSNGLSTPGSVSNGGSAGAATGVATTPSRISNIILPPNTDSTANNFAEIPNGRSLSGVVFLDYNNDGAINGPDHGLGGQVINLGGIDINGNPVSRTTATASDGSYSFSGLPAGSYGVTQPSQPDGTSNGSTLVGSTGGAATVPGISPSAISAIDLTNLNTVSANNNFAEVPDAAPDLAIAKTHAPASFAEAGSAGYYTITPSNIGTVATSGTISIIDTLPAGITVASPATGTGWVCLASPGASTVSCTSGVVIAAGASGNPITLRVAVAGGLSGQIRINTATISGGGEPPGFDGNNTATDPVTIATAAAIQGHVWLDRSHNRKFSDPLANPQPAWLVELLHNGTQVASTTTDAAGAYVLNGLAPGSGYQVRFRHPVTGLIFGNAVPNEDPATRPFVSGVVGANNPAGAVTNDGTLNNLTLLSGTTVVEQSLPVDPAGVVYDSVTRQPVSGAVVTIAGPGGFNPASHLVGGTASVTTAGDGYYQFLLNPGAPSGVYSLTVSSYPAGYLPSPSAMIPVCAASLVVGALPNPALVQDSNTAPATGVSAHNPAACPGIPGGSASTQHYSNFNISVGTSAHIVNNHIPLDPILGGAIVMSKTTPMTTISKGGLVPYTITATNTLAARLTNIKVVDRIPPGFRYRNGSATINGVAQEPLVSGRDMSWTNQTFAAGERKTYRIVLVVGAGVGEGDYVNQAWSLNSLVNSLVSNIASATVRVIPDPTFDCSDIIGKVFDDKNANGYQDEGEVGIANVRVVTARGLLLTTDAEGRFHVACAAIPQADHGSNFVMKLDERTLPSGFRLTTENPRDVRVTRGKMVKLNFGASVHRVVRLELTAAAFTEGNELAAPWIGKLDSVLAQLRDRPSVLRISYSGGGDQGRARLDGVVARFRTLWKKEGDKEVTHPLVIETELEGAK